MLERGVENDLDGGAREGYSRMINVKKKKKRLNKNDEIRLMKQIGKERIGAQKIDVSGFELENSIDGKFCEILNRRN